MTFADIHTHALYNSDDGAKSVEEMLGIIGASYDEGVRYICFTPHYHPGYYGKNRDKSRDSFLLAKELCAEKHPDLTLALGNELHYEAGCIEQVVSGACRTLGESSFVLVDFPSNENKRVILDALNRLLNRGYRPILAHAERYTSLFLSRAEIAQLRRDGVLIQVDAASPFGAYGLRARIYSRQLLSSMLVDFISSDAHDLTKRPPCMKRAYEYLSKKYNEQYATALCRDNALHLIFKTTPEVK